MTYTRRCVQMLYEDHQAVMALASEIDGLLGRSGRDGPDMGDDATRQLVSRAVEAIEHEVTDHFAFEEKSMFPLLREEGEDEICDHLDEDHRVILPLGKSAAAIARKGLQEGFDHDSWQKFVHDAGEFIERILAHAEKEDMAMLPLLEDILDAETDMQLAEEYASA